MVTRIQHVSLSVSDFDSAIEYYSEMLGFKEAFRIRKDDGSVMSVFVFINEGQFLELSKKKDRETVTHICYEVDDIQETVRHLTSKGVTLGREIVKGRSGSYTTWFLDPDGNKVELMQVLPDSMQGESRERL